MLKRTMTIAVGVCLFVLTGCCNYEEYDAQIRSLTGRLASLQTSYGDLQREKVAADAQLVAARNELTAALEKAAENQAIVDRLAAAKARLEQERDELRALARDLGDFIDIISRGGKDYMAMKSDILFAPGKDELTDEAKVGLDVIAGRLNEPGNSGLKIRIDGHTDGQPIRASGWKSNYHLACMRALAVRSYLASKGVDEGRMHVAGYGPNLPMEEPEEPAASVAANRRVEILIQPENPTAVEDLLTGSE